MKTHDLRAFFEQISLALCKYKRALCGKTVSIFFSPTLSEATRADLDLFFEMPFPYFLSQPFLFSTLEFYRSAKEAISFFGNDKVSAFVRFCGESIEWCLQERRGPAKRECLMKESVKVRSERSLSLSCEAF